jgi:lipopolysaccharide heptosyltransferase II
MLDFCIYLLYRAGSFLIGLLPLPFVFVLGEFLGAIGWTLLPKYRRLAVRNLQIAFGNEKNAREMRRLVRRHFRRLGANLLCSVKLGRMPLQKILRRIEVENTEEVHRLSEGKTPIVFLLSHLSNWELQAQLFPHFIGYIRSSTVYQKLGNRYIDGHMRRIRGRAGVELFDRSEGFHRAIDLLRGGGAIGILGDQHAGDHGLWTPFFGRLASTSPLPALLAKRTRAALIGANIYTNGRARWRFVFTERIDAPGDAIETLTAKANEIIARQIRVAPEDWFWVHNRWKTPKPHFLLTRYKRGIFVPANESLKPFRILIRAPNWLGDSIMSIPAVRAIKAGRPDGHITIAAPEKIAPVWKLVAEVDEVLAIPQRSLLATSRILKRQSPFDVAVLFPNSLRVALEVWLARVPRRAGFRGHNRRWLLNQVIAEREKPGPVEHQSNRYLRIARAIGAQTDDRRDVLPHVQISTEHKALASSDDVTKIGLCPGAEYGAAKRWLAERFIETAQAVSAQSNTHWIIFGTAKDAAISETIAKGLGENCTNRVGKTSIEDLISELRKCRLLLTNDTGTMHLAALLGLPVVAIFGSTEPRLTGPLGNGHIVLRHQVECSPCFLRECPIDFRCMKAVTTNEVVSAVLSKLLSKPHAE